MSEELKCCPFCGGEAAHNTMRTNDKETIRLNGQDTFCGVNCVSCGVNNRGLIGYKTQDEATAAWNRRQQVPEGFVLVPKVPSEEMLKEAFPLHWNQTPAFEFTYRYRLAIAATSQEEVK